MKRFENAKGLWTKELLSLLWAYCTTPRALTGETPFSLTFKFDAMVPTEVSLASYRVGTLVPMKMKKY